MDTSNMTHEELAQLLEVPPEWEPQAVPCAINTRDKLLVFTVNSVNAWGYTDYGVFAVGSWGIGLPETSVLIPYDNISYIEFDFDALARYQEGDGTSTSD